MAGYSKHLLVDKLGIKSGNAICLINSPKRYKKNLGNLPGDVRFVTTLKDAVDFIQFFTTKRSELEKEFTMLKKHVVPNGMLWISWPKGSSKIPTDLNENIIRDIGLTNGMVDVKVCAIDDDWSGLKFVFRLKDRKT